LKLATIRSRLVPSVMRLFRGDRSRSGFTRDLPQFAQFEIGEWTYGTPTVLNYPNGGRLRVGRFCSIAPNVCIFLGGEHRIEWVTTYPFAELWPQADAQPGHPTSKGDVIIGNDVWIGRGAVILSGVSVGHGAVIGAFSVVTKEVAPYAIVAGNPARLVRLRFTEAEIQRLLDLAWWDWPVDKISALIPSLTAGDIGTLCDGAARWDTK
jgi:virginiamycin A acetyltransferase